MYTYARGVDKENGGHHWCFLFWHVMQVCKSESKEFYCYSYFIFTKIWCHATEFTKIDASRVLACRSDLQRGKLREYTKIVGLYLKTTKVYFIYFSINTCEFLCNGLHIIWESIKIVIFL